MLESINWQTANTTSVFIDVITAPPNRIID